MYAAQVALSGVARAQGRVGKNLVAQMLTGSESKRLKQLGMVSLSTFGMFKDFRQEDVVALIDRLIAHGFINSVEHTKFRPVIEINEKGRQLMTGRLSLNAASFFDEELMKVIAFHLRGKKPVVSSVQETSSRYEVDVDGDLDVDADWDDADSVDSPLNAPVEVDPLEVDHLDLSPCDRFEIVEDVLQEMEIEADIDSGDDSEFVEERVERQDRPSGTVPSAVQPNHVHSSHGSRITLPAPHEPMPSYFWTCCLLLDGYSVEHVQQIRRLNRDDLFDHALRGIENGIVVEPEKLLDPTGLKELKQFHDLHQHLSMAEMLTRIRGGFSPSELTWFVKYQSQAGTAKKVAR